MPSPFPGMDPYLEAHWPDVHTSMVTYMRAHLNRVLPAGLCARAEETVKLDEFDDEESASTYRKPDTAVYEDGESTRPRVTCPVVTMEPLIFLRESEPRTRRSVQIRTRKSNKLVTAIELISPSNKISSKGESEYRKRIHDFLSSGASVVEIDLLRQGTPVFAFHLAAWPKPKRTPYGVHIIRGWQRSKSQLFPIDYLDPLPVIPIPLRKTDTEVSLDLQAILTEAYDNGAYGASLYKEELEPQAHAAEEAWVDAILKRKKKSKTK